MQLDQRIYQQFNNRAPFKLEHATVMALCLIGSHSHGTYIPPSDPQAIDDVDYMGIIVPPVDFTLGTQEWEGLNFQFEELDCVFYSFKKFISLLIKSNPNVLGLLWLKPEFVIDSHPLWENSIVKNRSLFSSLMAYHSFIGYAHGQFKKMESFDLKTQQEWEEAIKTIEAVGWTKEAIIEGQSLDMPKWDNVHYVQREYESLDSARKSILRIHARHFKGFMGEKRKKLVTKYGYDTKNAAHLIRLMRMCVEFLQTGELNVYRAEDGDYLRDMKQGKFTLQNIKDEAEALFVKAKEVKDASSLPEEPDVSSINALCVKTYYEVYKEIFAFM